MKTDLQRSNVLCCMLYVMMYICYMIYVIVCVYFKIFMLFIFIQTIPSKDHFDHLIVVQLMRRNIYLLSLNGFWHPTSLLARTKVGSIYLIRSQQLCSGILHIEPTINFYSYGNRALGLIGYIITNKVSKNNIKLRVNKRNIVCHDACAGPLGMAAHRGSTNSSQPTQKLIILIMQHHYE